LFSVLKVRFSTHNKVNKNFCHCFWAYRCGHNFFCGSQCQKGWTALTITMKA